MTQQSKRIDLRTKTGADFHIRSLIDTLDLHVDSLNAAAERTTRADEYFRLRSAANATFEFAQRLRERFRD